MTETSWIKPTSRVPATEKLDLVTLNRSDAQRSFQRTANEESRLPRTESCIIGDGCSCVLAVGPIQHDSAVAVAISHNSSTTAFWRCRNLLAVLFFALLTAVLVPATTAQAACSVVGQPCVRDDFDSRAYDLNTGTDDWTTDWAETGESDGPELGVILVPVSLGELRFQAVFGSNEENYAITRNVDIPAAANNATLRLNVGYEGTLGSSKFLEVTANSIPFGIISGSAVPNPATYSYDLDSVLGPIGGTTISVRLTNLDDLGDTPDYWTIDFVEVTYDSPLAISLADFSAQQSDDHVLVAWETASELDNQGFNLYRSTSDAAPQTQLNDALIPSQAPGSAIGHLYTWEDWHDLVSGATYFYWLEDVSLSGATTLHGPVSATYNGPTAVTLAGLQAESPTTPNALPAITLALALLLPLLALRATRCLDREGTKKREGHKARSRGETRRGPSHASRPFAPS